MLRKCKLLCAFHHPSIHAFQHLSKTTFDMVKRWMNEAQEAASSDNIRVQYHALGLLYHIRKSDKLAVTKLVTKFSKYSLMSPYACSSELHVNFWRRRMWGEWLVRRMVELFF